MPTQAATINDLLTWQTETGARLPVGVSAIAYLESLGWIVDLETGERFRDPDAPALLTDQPVNQTEGLRHPVTH